MEGENSSERAIPESVPPGGDGVQAAEAAVGRDPNPGPACTETERRSVLISSSNASYGCRPIPDQRSREEAERQSRPYRPDHSRCRKPAGQTKQREREWERMKQVSSQTWVWNKLNGRMGIRERTWRRSGCRIGNIHGATGGAWKFMYIYSSGNVLYKKQTLWKELKY